MHTVGSPTFTYQPLDPWAELCRDLGGLKPPQDFGQKKNYLYIYSLLAEQAELIRRQKEEEKKGKGRRERKEGEEEDRNQRKERE